MKGLLPLALMLSACGGGTPLEQAKHRLKGGGDVSELKATNADSFHATKCLGGPVEKMDVVLCEYGSVEAAKLGKRAAEDWVGQAPTGAVLDDGKTVLAVADRAHADANGKIIHKLTAAYRPKQ